MSSRLFVYKIVTDAGTAPHVSNGYLTLTICKPVIRKSAVPGDYVLALVALQHKNIVGTGEDRYFKAAYLFKVTEVVPMESYESWCEIHAPNKICTSDFFEGDCQYNASLTQRPGPHLPNQRNRNIGGRHSIISNHFAAWTSATPRTLQSSEMKQIGDIEERVKKLTQGHFIVPLTDPSQIDALEQLIGPAPTSLRSLASSGKSCTKRRTRKQVARAGKTRCRSRI